MKKMLFIFFSFILGAILMIMPFPHWGHWLKPEWMSVILIFWVVFEPQLIGVGVAWCLGFLMDGLKGGWLGQTALAMAVVSYLAQILGARLRFQPFWHQALCILVLVGLGQLILLMTRWIAGAPPSTDLVWISTLTSVLVWPFVFRFLSLYKTRLAGGDMR